MKCAACGNENQPGAKFCVHCGIVLGAASASATVSAPPPTPLRPVKPVAVSPTVARPAIATPAPAASAAAASAAAAEEPQKMGLIAVVVALVVVLAIGGYFAYRMLRSEGRPTIAAVEPPKAEQNAPAPAPAPSPPASETTTPQQPTPSVAPGAAPPPIIAPSAEPATAARAPAAEATAPPSAVEGGKAPSAQTKAAQPKVVPKAPLPTGEAPPKAATPPAPAAQGRAQAKAAAAPQADRWQQLAEALGQCKSEKFFARIGCENRARNHYCEGYWGQVAQCPSAPTKDHGQ